VGRVATWNVELETWNFVSGGGVRRETVGERPEQNQLDQLSINTIRMLAVDAVQAANSGHPGAPMGAAPLAYVLWTKVLRHNPLDPTWPDRDRFVLSAGHASMLLYALLYLTGYNLPLKELKRFRQWDSRTPGHPENVLTPGVEVTTGPLGQGFANGVGMAIAERYLAAQFNRPGHEIVDHRVYALVSDGDLQEGVASEAASLAGRLRLGKLIYLYDDNRVQLDGPTEWAFTEDVGKRFEAYGWQVQRIDGEDLAGIEVALAAAKAETQRPSLVMVRTVIGYGSPNRAGTSKAHGEALGADEVRLTKQALGWPEEPTFSVPEAALERFRAARERGRALQTDWEWRFAAYAEAYPEQAHDYRRRLAGELPAGWDADLPRFSPSDGAVATRVASSTVLSTLVERLPELLGG
jgi:transketolase